MELANRLSLSLFFFIVCCLPPCFIVTYATRSSCMALNIFMMHTVPTDEGKLQVASSASAAGSQQSLCRMSIYSVLFTVCFFFCSLPFTLPSRHTWPPSPKRPPAGRRCLPGRECAPRQVLLPMCFQEIPGPLKFGQRTVGLGENVYFLLGGWLLVLMTPMVLVVPAGTGRNGSTTSNTALSLQSSPFQEK